MDEDYPRCGAPTKTGKPCRTRVSTYNPERCLVHRGQPDPPMSREHLVAVRLASNEAITMRRYARQPYEDLQEVMRMLPIPEPLTA